MNITAETVKQLVTMEMVINAYGIKVNRAGYVNCPFHGEKTPSCKLYTDGSGYYCYGCGKGGDVISFVQGLFGIDFRQAIERMNADFALNLDTRRKPTRRDVGQYLKRQKEIEAQRASWRASRDSLIDEYEEACKEISRLKSYRTLKPKTPDEEPNPLWTEYIKNIDYAQYVADCIAERIAENDKHRFGENAGVHGRTVL